MNLYFYATFFGEIDVKETVVENVSTTADGFFKSADGVFFPFFEKNTLNTNLADKVFQYAGNGDIKITNLCFLYTTEHSIKRATKIFEQHYNSLINEFEGRIAKLKNALNNSYNRHLEEMLEKAKVVAAAAHFGQKDKGGNPYFKHPETVASMVNGTKEKIVAYLHDVIEDTPITAEFLLEQGFDTDIVNAVTTLSKDAKTDYDTYISNIKNNNLARAVKIADLTHNSDISRIPNPTEKDYNRVEKYKKMYSFS